MIEWLKVCQHRHQQKRLDKLVPERKICVRIDEVGLSATYPSGEVEEIAWDAICRVTIVTTDTGPFAADFWFLFEGVDSQCGYPLAAIGDWNAFNEFHKRFPDIQEEALGNAIRSTHNEKFVIWERDKCVGE